MENTIKKGDLVILSKIHYGPKVPNSWQKVPWVGELIGKLSRHKASNTFFNQDKNQRLNGFTDPKIGDIIIFKHPKSYVNLIKRCFGTPKDTIQIREGEVWVNSKKISQTNTVKLRYEALANTPDKWSLNGSSVDTITHFFDNSEVESFRIKHSQTTLYRKITGGNKKNYIHSYNLKSDWSIDNYGPIIIPFKGMEISTTDPNFPYYFEIIRDSETEDIVTFNGKYFINEKLIESYTFRKGYYFLLGDNRYNSIDSRNFGLVPENLVDGKAIKVGK
jgi:signal peptidase I